MSRCQLIEKESEGYDNSGYEGDSSSLSSAESIYCSLSSDDDDIPPPPPPLRSAPSLPPRQQRRKRYKPLNPMQVMLHTVMNEVGMLSNSSSSSATWNHFFNALAEKLAYMEQIVNHVKTHRHWRDIYKTKQNMGGGLIGWKVAIKSHHDAVMDMVRDINTV